MELLIAPPGVAFAASIGSGARPPHDVGEARSRKPPPGEKGILTPMSLRPELSGFSLEALKSQLGTGDEEMVSAVREELRVMVDFDDPQEFDRAVRVIERAVFDGIPFEGLDVEGEPHVVAAIALAHHGQDHLPTESNVWKMEALEELSRTLEGTLPPEAAANLGHLLDGRPIFGRGIETDWNYYAFLTAGEVRALRKGLEDARTETPDPTEDGFLSDLLAWLGEIADNGMDLWFHAA